MITSNKEILKRLYRDYTKRYIRRILLSVFFTLILAGSTSAVAYLLDPAIKQLFIEQKKNTYLHYTGSNHTCFRPQRSILIPCKSYNDKCV